MNRVVVISARGQRGEWIEVHRGVEWRRGEEWIELQASGECEWRGERGWGGLLGSGCRVRGSGQSHRGVERAKGEGRVDGGDWGVV